MRRTCFLLVLLGLLPGTAWEMAQPPMAVIKLDKSNTEEAAAVASQLQTRISIELLRLCVPHMADTELGSLLGYEKAREVLGANDGGRALDAALARDNVQYVITVSASENGGEMSLFASMVNTYNGEKVADSSMTVASGEGAIDAATSLAEEFVSELSSLATKFDSGCEPHWSGIITFTLEQKTGSEKSGPVAGGGEGSHYSMKESYHTTEKTEAVLLNLPQGGGDTNHPMARLTYSYDEHDAVEFSKTQQVKCGPAGVGLPDPRRVVSGGYSDVTDDHGTTSSRKPVSIISDSSTGEYSFDIGTLDLTTKRTETNRDANSNLSCTSEEKPEEKSVVTKGENYHAGGRVTAGGRVDPEHPNILSGQKVIGDLENGRYTTTWNLRLVKPNPPKK